MAKNLGLSVNRGHYLGRVMAAPDITGDWAKFYMKTLVPENQNGQWADVECIVPMMTNNPKTITTTQNFVQEERQLYIEGYTKGWLNVQGAFECAIMITNIKLGSKTMYDPDAQGGNQAQGGQPGGGGGQPGFPPA